MSDSKRDEAASTQGDADGATEITIGPGILIGAVVLVGLLAFGAWFVLRDDGGLGLPGASQQSGSAPAGDVLAYVNGEPITQRQVDVEFYVQKDLQRRVMGKILDESPEAVAGFKRDLLDRMVDRRLAMQEAGRQGVVIDDAMLDASIPTLGENFGLSSDVIRNAIIAEGTGLTEQDFREWARDAVTLQTFAGSPAAQAIGQQHMQLYGRPIGQVDEQVIGEVLAADPSQEIVFIMDGQEVRPVREGEIAPDIELLTPDGEVVKLSDFRGRPVMVNFWATWCGPCRIEMPLFVNAHETNEDLVVLGVNSQEDPVTVQNYVDAMRLTFPVILDRDGATSTVYRVKALPTTFFLDRDGRVVRAHRGTIPNRPTLKPMLDEILVESEAFAPSSASPSLASSETP